MDTTSHKGHTLNDVFDRDSANLPAVTQSPIIDLADGETFDLVAAPVRKMIGEADVRMLAYNGSIPGPTLRVRQGSEVTINFTNLVDVENTVHWHGLRLANQYDGTHETQAPVPQGGSFAYHITFPDPGVYWYHPHVREDYSQEMGLYGNIVVVPAEPDYWPPVNREVVLTLDDILIEGAQVAPFSRTETNHVAMGRFGNVLLTAGETDLSLTAQSGEVVRFYLTNTANTRVFNVRMDGARMKLVGGDSGRCETEAYVGSVVLAPSERAVVDVLFDRPGQATLEHRTPDSTYVLASIEVSIQPASPSLVEQYETLRSDDELSIERQRMSGYVDAAPDRTIAFVAEMNLGATDGPATYTCPMHPDVVSNDPGRCPACGMKLLPLSVVEQTGGHHSHHASGGHASHDHDHHANHNHHTGSHHHVELGHGAPGHQVTDGIEWEDDMEEVNRMTTPANTRWKIVDRTSGSENHAIDWTFRVGDRVKIRLVNEMDSDHPMHHPFHVHGAGRFLVLSRDGIVEPNLLWKDTVLVRTGQTVDILLDVTNPGVWMAHCHIAEHHEAGMMFSFKVIE